MVWGFGDSSAVSGMLTALCRVGDGWGCHTLTWSLKWEAPGDIRLRSGICSQVKAPAGQSYTQEDIQCHVHYALYPSSNRDQLGDKRQRTADED